MKVRDLHWTAFRLPLRREFVTARAAFAYREGVIVRLGTDAGIVGIGEASPLPRGGETALPRVLALLDLVATACVGRRLDDLDPILDELGRDRPAGAAVRCALDVALCDAMAKAAGISLAAFLASPVRPSVTVNATIGASAPTDTRVAALAARAAGFRCVKLKVGMARSLDEECKQVAAVRDAVGPQIKLRLDANGAWTVEQAIRTIRALELYDPEFVEQPVRPDDLAGLKQVQEAVHTPIAADESITDYDTARRILEREAVRILILKPMVLGGLRPARQIADLAQTAAIPVVVTTTIDAGMGTAAALHLAATLPPSAPACGLATASFLASDLLTRPLTVRDGQMRLPQEPGLGVEVDAVALQRYGVRSA